MSTARRLLVSLAVSFVLVASGDGRAFQIYQPFTGNDYIRSSPPDGQPSFTHWDLRAYSSCSLPWSIRYPSGAVPRLDVDLNGTNNDAADKAAVQAALAAALATWQGVVPATVELSMLGVAPNSVKGIARDKYNLFSFESSLAQDDQQCVAVGGGAAGAFFPVVAPGPDLVLTTQAQGDDMILPCIVTGADGSSDTLAVGDDVQIVLPGGATGGCNVVVTAGPNGRMDTAPNNAPMGVIDDMFGACVAAGPDAMSGTPANNQGTAPGSLGLTGLFFNTASGVIVETDIEFDTAPATFWSTNPNAVQQPAAITAGPDGDVDSVAAGDDTQNFPVGMNGLSPDAVVIGPGPNRALNTLVAAGDAGIQTTDVQMVGTHEVGHTLGIAHPVNGRLSDDAQVVAVGGAVAAGGIVVGPGGDLRLATMPLGDDVVSGTNIVDGGNGIAETTANNAQEANSTAAGVTRNIMNPFMFVPGVTNHLLSVDDTMACNWMYTPDLGDAPDACPWPPGAFNKYQSKVHTTTVVDTLNAQNVFDVAKGPDHLFGYLGPAAPAGRQYRGMRYEWMGADMDDNAAECEARLQDADAFDDAVVFPDPLIRGQVNRFTVTLTHTNKVGRYDLGDTLRHMYFNGYFDWTQTCLFTPAQREIWWDGIPGTTVAKSPNWVSTAHTFATHPNPSTIIINYDVFVPLNAAPEFYCRFRLDYGENEARVRNVNGDLNPAEHVAQFGEVEDRICRTVEVDDFLSSLAVVDLRYPANSPTEHLVTLTGPATVHVDLGGIADTDLNGREQVSTSMEQLQLTGTDPNFGTVIVRRRDPLQHPFLASTGQIEENSNLTPGTLDISPFVPVPPGLTATSFFDMYPEVQLPSLGITMHTHAPKHMLGTISHKPPGPGDTYWNPDYVPLYDSNEILVAVIGPGYHTPDPPLVPPEIDLFSATTATVDVRVPAGNPVPRLVQVTGPSAVRVDLPAIADTDGDLNEQVTTEMFSLDLQGTDPGLGNVRVRVRPSGVHPFQKTIGEIEEQSNLHAGVLDLPPFTTSPPNLAADSYFDVYFQVELQSFGDIPLHNHVAKHMTSVIHNKPPAAGDSYQSPTFIDLYDDAENLVAQLGPGQHVPHPFTGAGACCTPSGCTQITASHCAAVGGNYMGGGSQCTACSNGPCTGAPNGTPCDDLNACTVSDVCSLGSCVGSPVSPLFPGIIRVNKVSIANPEPDFNASISWNSTQASDAIRGSLQQLKSAQSFTPSVQTCLANDLFGTSLSDPGSVIPGGGAYYLMRPVPPAGCSQPGSYSTGAAKERPGRDAQIGANPSACP